MIHVLVGLIFTWIIPAQAYLAISEVGEPLAGKTYTITGGAQLNQRPLEGGQGQITVKWPFQEDMDLTFQIGAGQVAKFLQVGGRWVPIPDVDNQPALGLKWDVSLAQERERSLGLFRIAPFGSKKFLLESGFLEPYLYMPVGVALQEQQFFFVAQLVTGVHWGFEDIRPFSFYTEIGWNLRDMFSYFYLGLRYWGQWF